MALRLSSSLSRRLEALTRVTRKSDIGKRYQLATVLGPQVLTEQDMSELTLWQRTVLSWPTIMGVDEWSEAAQDAQLQLVRETGEWLGPAPEEPEMPDPMDVTHRYKPDPARVKPIKLPSTSTEGSEPLETVAR